MYDGVGTPDQPYRYVGKVPAPGIATLTVTTDGNLYRVVATSGATSFSGRDNLATPFRKTGDYAVIRLPGATALGSGGPSASQIAVLIGGIALLLLITVLVLRRRAPVS